MERWLQVMHMVSHQAGEAAWLFFDPRNPSTSTGDDGSVTLSCDGLPDYTLAEGEAGAWTASAGEWSSTGSLMDCVRAIVARGEV